MDVKNFLKKSFLSLSLISALNSYSLSNKDLSINSNDYLLPEIPVSTISSDSISSKDYQTLDSLIRSSTIKMNNIHFDSLVFHPLSNEQKTAYDSVSNQLVVSYYGFFIFNKYASQLHSNNLSYQQNIKLESVVNDSSKLLLVDDKNINSILKDYLTENHGLTQRSFIHQKDLQKKLSQDLRTRKSDMVFFFDYLDKQFVSDSKTSYKVLVEITESERLNLSKNTLNKISNKKVLDFTSDYNSISDSEQSINNSTFYIGKKTQSNNDIIASENKLELKRNENKKAMTDSSDLVRQHYSLAMLVGGTYNLSTESILPSVKLSFPLVKDLSLLIGWTNYKTDSSFTSVLDDDAQLVVNTQLFESHFNNLHSEFIKNTYLFDFGLSYNFNSWILGLTSTLGSENIMMSDQLLQKDIFIPTGEVLAEHVPVGPPDLSSSSRLKINFPGLFVEKVFRSGLGLYVGSNYDLDDSSFSITAGLSYHFRKK